MRPTAEDVLAAHELLELAELDRTCGPVDLAYRIAAYVAEQREELPHGHRFVAWLREYAASNAFTKYDAHVLEEAAKILEDEK